MIVYNVPSAEPTIERLSQSLSDLPVPQLAVTKAQSSISPPVNATEPYGVKSMYAPRPVRGYSTTSSNGFGSASTPNINASGSSSAAAAAYAGSPWGTPGATQRAGLPRMSSDLDPMAVTTPGTLQRGDSILGYDTPALNEYSQGNIVEEGEEHDEVEDMDADKGLSAENMKGWWKELETVQVSLLPDKEGWFLQKYKVESDVSIPLLYQNTRITEGLMDPFGHLKKRTGGSVHRRYSDFVWLLDCLSHRYVGA